jgi:two-component system NarL family response regulator
VVIEQAESGGTGQLRIHLLVDQALVAHAYRELLARRREHVVSGASRSPEGCLASAPLENADLVIFDLRESEHAGFGWVTELKRRLPHVRVLMLREFLSSDYVGAALAAGVDGALVRTEDASELFLALDALRRGQTFLSRRLGVPTSSLDTDSSERELHSAREVGLLSEFERRVFEELALGRRAPELAALLDLDLRQALELEANMRERLDCRSSAELARLAIRTGILPRGTVSGQSPRGD